jgi:hypothetical protein
MFDRSRHLAVIFALVSLTGGAAGCSKKDGDATQSAEAQASALVEVFETGSLAWTIDDAGKVRLDVRDKDGTSISKKAAADLEWQTETGEQKTVKLAFDDKANALAGTGPAAKGDITLLRYKVTGGAAPMTGTLHVPVGGTIALAKDATEAEKVTAPATGPNGGVVQVVGDDRIEVVGDEDSDQVRVFVLGADGKAVPVGERKVTLAVNADASEVVALTPSPDGLYLIGKWKVKSDPSRLTIVVRRAGAAHVALVGWKPGVKIVVLSAPKLKVRVKGGGLAKGLDKDDKPDAPGGPTLVKVDLKGKDDDKGKDKGPDKGKDGPDHDKGKGNDKPGHDDKGKGNDKDKGKGK